jgi:ABC-type Zn uptake system ZnuABC Zn-binding protein ZnuA
MLRKEKYQDLLGYENQIETIHKDFGEIDPTHKIQFIEVNNSQLKKKLLNEVTEIRGNVKGLIRNKFISHIQGIVNLLQEIKDEFKESVEYPNNSQDKSILEKFKFKTHRLDQLKLCKND